MQDEILKLLDDCAEQSRKNDAMYNDFVEHTVMLLQLIIEKLKPYLYLVCDEYPIEYSSDKPEKTRIIKALKWVDGIITNYGYEKDTYSGFTVYLMPDGRIAKYDRRGAALWERVNEYKYEKTVIEYKDTLDDDYTLYHLVKDVDLSNIRYYLKYYMAKKIESLPKNAEIPETLITFIN